MSDTFTISKKDGRVYFKGSINEDADLTSAFSDEGALEFDLSEVSRINSCGVREWINAIRKFDGPITFHRCSVAIVEQLNMIQDFGSQGKVDSFYAPYFCAKCGDSKFILLSIEEHGKICEDGEAPELNCPSCGDSLEFDDDEDEYFSFLEKDA